ncbi:MAG: DUF401 family protein [bacterium]|nr:DUF401 family protein [bacterium]
MDSLRLLAVFIAIILAVRRNFPVGIVLLGASLLMAVLFGMAGSVLWSGLVDLVRSESFITLTSVVILITLLGSLLSTGGYLEKLATAVTGLPGGNRTAVMTLPPLIGLMPMPGGSLLSAPLVKQVLEKQSVRPELQMMINYWFRHVAEFFWPIYPGIILTEAMTGLPVVNVSLMQFPMSLMAILIGLFLFIRKIVSVPKSEAGLGKSLLRLLGSIWPILLAITLYGGLELNLSLSVLVAVLCLALVVKPSKSDWKVAFGKAFSYKLISLVFGVLMFQMVIETGETVAFVPDLASQYNLPAELIVFLVCFTVGVLTGVVAAYVGLGFSLLAGFLYQPTIDPSMILWAYVSGFAGVMMSPSHLCLILTNEYFGSQLAAVYRLLTPAVILVLTAGLLLANSGWPSIFLP